jgi:ABC-type transport system involved in multi-copper enzyme maturation permease subunit
LGLAPFGQEFSTKTFTFLLVQPQPRRRLFFLKTAAAAVALLSVWLALYLSCQFRFASVTATRPMEAWLSEAALYAVVLFTGGLWTTILFRQYTASLMVTLLAPGLFWLPVAGIYLMADKMVIPSAQFWVMAV